MKKKTILIIIGAVLLALIIFLITRIPKRVYNTFEFPSTMVVKNSTPNRMADTIIMAMLNKIMGYDTMKVDIFPMPSLFADSCVAITVKQEYAKHSYSIFLQNKLDVSTMKTALAHELIHVKQYELNILEDLLDNYGYVWKGDTVRYVDVKYENRPYEIEAYRDGPKLEKRLNKILYKKIKK